GPAAACNTTALATVTSAATTSDSLPAYFNAPPFGSMTPTSLRPPFQKSSNATSSAQRPGTPLREERCAATRKQEFEPSLWDSSMTHVASSTNQNPRFPGVLEADEGTRTLDLLHGKQTL